MAKAKPKTDAIELPTGIKESDLKYPSWKSKHHVVHTLDMYFVTTFGWCIATLHIRNASRRKVTNTDARTYAVRVDTEQCVRVGLGPHVLKRVTVYVTEKRLPALQKYVDLQASGEVTANEIRDRISTRRAQGALRRRDIFGF